MNTADPLETLRLHLAHIETAIAGDSWETVTESWTPPPVGLSEQHLDEAAILLARIEEARDEVGRLEAESADIRAEIDRLRQAGRAYVTNDALL